MSDRDKEGIDRLNQVISACNNHLRYWVMWNARKATQGKHTLDEAATEIELWLSRRNAVKQLRDEVFPSTVNYKVEVKQSGEATHRRYAVHFSVGNQSFKLFDEYIEGTDEDAEWMANQLRVALAKIVARN